MSDHGTAELPIPPLSDGTKAAIANIVDYTILREYSIVITDDGLLVEDAMTGARMIALAGLQFDLHHQFVEMNGNDRGLSKYAEATLPILVRDGLAERVCQCRELHGVCPHAGNSSKPICANHYETDVPEIDGALLCGPCHIDEYQARHGEEN
jgi:hypothetical protein